MACNPLEAEISKQADDSNTRCTSLHTHTHRLYLFFQPPVVILPHQGMQWKPEAEILDAGSGGR